MPSAGQGTLDFPSLTCLPDQSARVHPSSKLSSSGASKLNEHVPTLDKRVGTVTTWGMVSNVSILGVGMPLAPSFQEYGKLARNQIKTPANLRG
jgi:hypothetical protein